MGWRRGTLAATLGWRVGLIALLVIVLPPFLPGVGAAEGAPHTPVPAAPLPAALCSGTTTPSSFSGSLFVDGGGSSPPSVAGVSVALSYWADLNFTPLNGSTIYSCVPERAQVATDGLGGFVLAAPLPTSGCGRYSCTTYTGPYGPLVFSTPNGTPAGYFLTQSITGNQVGLAYVSALSSTRLAPSSRVTLSANAPTVVRAYPTAGNGGPSPASVGFAWQLLGSGWRLLNGSGTANVTIEATDTAGSGTLTVWTNGTYNGTAVAAPSATLDLAAATTTVAGSNVFPTRLDVGYPATFTVTGRGASGYSYHADLSPGLNASPATAPCTTSIVAGGLVALTCTVSVTYPAAGAALPAANLTNGFSSDSATFVGVTVAPTLGISVTPAAVVAYKDDPVAVSITADVTTGTSPRGPACLWPGTGRSFCDGGSGPSFPFSVAYGTVGPYSGKATITDISGANTTVPFSAQIFDRPVLSPLVASTNRPGVTQSTSVVGTISGGALPIAYWWNSSQTAGTLYSGVLTSDGSLVLNFVPRLSGLTTITLTTVDALGSRNQSPTRMNVSAGPATALRVAVSAGAPILAGQAVPIAWSAVDPVGEIVGNWSKPASLVLSPGPGGPDTMPTVWVNVSGAPVPPAADGSFPIPVPAWSQGTLRVTVDFAGAGDFRALLTAGLTLLDGGPGGIDLVVGPDTGNLTLTHPVVGVAGVRTNHTLYRIADRFGDALRGGSIRVETNYSGATYPNSSGIFADPPMGSVVWVNYSVPDGVAATVTVRSAAGNLLLPPILIRAPSAGSGVPVAWLLIALGTALAAAAAFGLWRRIRRPTPPEPFAPLGEAASEDELRRWAEGRAHILTRASTERGQTLDELAEVFVGRPPRPEEMTDWVASLVAEGSLRTVLGDDGRSRFLKTIGDDASPLRVQLDDRALDEALDRRRALEAADDPSGEEPP